ncbi:PQQ-binding-like beta-propeller repeat protein [candidate division WOR-3 bacterium]|uniref:PQQ-binding-like beta-propeller repeat protein n=1 Tax=candidate division WOR-3 bacterium TaxID=2052148 RepID=A0A9D5QEI8_UNCW3|nr:PQQ-binding-like beta-propeller repeat protein [candidate division WOR-3 bacterium]MBD3365085.1 PQQ-binding-like beta-propeller repeat protein [candidate division WOR-3 bacterium]
MYFWSHDGYLNALNTEGEVIWRYETEDSMEYFPAVGPDKTVYFGAKNGYFYALNPEGELKWKFQTGDEIWSTPAITEDGTIYFGSKDNYLYALTSEGKLKWKYKTGDDIRWSKPLIAHDGTVIIGSWDGYLYGLTSKGKLRYRYKASAGIDFSPALIDSTIYFSSGSMLYALKVSTIERYADTDSIITDELIPQAPVVTGGAGLARVADARTPEVNTWTFGTSFAGDRHGADHMNDWNITTWENAVFRIFASWIPLDKLEINAAAGLGYTYLADTGALEPALGLWDGEIGARYEFLRKPQASVAAGARTFIPLRDLAFGGPRFGGAADLLASLSSRDIEGLRMHANLGTEYLENVSLTWGLGIEYHLAILNPYLEFTGEVASGGAPIRVTPGLRILTDFGLSAYYTADFGLNLAARSIDLRGRDYVDQVSAGIAFSY